MYALVHTGGMQEVKKTSSMRISPETRDALQQIAETEMPGASLDSVVERLVFEHQTRAAFARMTEGEREDYLAEAAELAEVDVEVVE